MRPGAESRQSNPSPLRSIKHREEQADSEKATKQAGRHKHTYLTNTRKRNNGQPNKRQNAGGSAGRKASEHTVQSAFAVRAYNCMGEIMERVVGGNADNSHPKNEGNNVDLLQ